MTAKSGVIFVPDRNTHGKKDLTGAFLPEAKRFAREHQLAASAIVKIDVGKARIKRQQSVIDAIKTQADKQDGLDFVAFFCHGYRYRLQVGFGSRSTVDERWLRKLAKAVYDNTGWGVVLPLYACTTATSDRRKHDQTAAGDGGFADELRDALCREGADQCRVVGHTTSGHTTKNPFVRVFEGNGSTEGGTGGQWISRPRGPTWRRWKTWLREGNNRFHFPFMETSEIIAKLPSPT